MGRENAPRADRMEGLLSLFERIRERPTRRDGDRLRPLLITIGSAHENRQAAHLFVEGCIADGGPYGHIAADSADAERLTDLALLLRHVSRQLSAHRRRFEPALKFPLLSMALWLLELRRMRLRQEQNAEPAQFVSNAERHAWQLAGDLLAADGDAQWRTLLRRGILRRRQVVVPAERPGQQGRLASVLSHLEQLAPIGVAAVAVVSAGAASTVDLAVAMLVAAVGLAFVFGQVAARTRDRAGRRRYRWFTAPEQRHLRGNRSVDFLGFGIDVFFRDEAASGAPIDEEIERLLAAAFLQDLRQAYRRGIWRAAWARVRYPAVVIDLFPEENPCRAQSRRFVERIEEVRRGEERFDPLVVAVAVGSEEEAGELAAAVRAPLAEPAVVDLGALRETENGHEYWDGHTAGQRRVAVLGTRREFRVDIGHGDGSSTEPVYRGRRRPLMTHPALPWITMGAILAASVSVITFQAVRYCAPFTVWRADNGECVGVTDGSYIFNKRLAAVERRIERLNADVTSSGKQYITIVYVGPMTVDPDSKNPQADLLAGIHGELAGLSIAQQRHNEASGQPLLRLLLANAGAKNRHAERVAEEIRERAARDRTIVAAVGFGHSRKQTNQAIEVLSKVALPMVGTTNTFDGTGRQKRSFSPYYFRLSPPNRQLARHAAHWARSGRLGVRAKRVDVFYDIDADDLYSQNLYRDFAEEFGAGKVRPLGYADATEVSSKVLQACENPAELFYYAGRSDEFRLFIKRLSDTSCGGKRVVMAGDEVTKYVSDNAAEIGRNPSIRLFYTPLAAREAWSRTWVGDQPEQVFYSEFEVVTEQLVGKSAKPNERPSRTHAALGYDAALAVVDVAERIYGDQGRTLPTSAAILSELTEPDQGATSQGASGLLLFGPRTIGHQIKDKPVLLAEVRTGGALQISAVCGRLVKGGKPAKDCPSS